MKQNVKVSIICNVFNHSKYLRDALEGVVSQKCSFDYELLIHDDASTDQSAEIIREYESKYPNIIKPIYQTENQYSQGIDISRTFQMPRAKGKYVAICEGDDYWTDPLKLEKQCLFLEEHPEYTMCTCSTEWLNMLTGRCENKGSVDFDMDIPLEDIIQEKNGRIFQLASVMVRREIWADWPHWRELFPIGDLPLAILAGINGKIRMLADTMCVYRWYSAGSWTARMDNERHRAKVTREMITALTALDEQTSYEYHEEISRRIKRQKYTLALMEHDLGAIWSSELKDVYRSRNLLLRLSDVTRCKFPGAYGAVRKITKRFIK